MGRRIISGGRKEILPFIHRVATAAASTTFRRRRSPIEKKCETTALTRGISSRVSTAAACGPPHRPSAGASSSSVPFPPPPAPPSPAPPPPPPRRRPPFGSTRCRRRARSTRRTPRRWSAGSPRRSTARATRARQVSQRDPYPSRARSGVVDFGLWCCWWCALCVCGIASIGSPLVGYIDNTRRRGILFGLLGLERPWGGLLETGVAN